MNQRPDQSTARPQISVAMATYNGAKFLREQLESIARQTLLPAEIVVTDDGSTDTTLGILDNFAQTAPFPVRVFGNSSRLGYEDNFLKAASLCASDWIAFCDQDDIWLETKLRICSQFFSDHNVVLVIHSARTFMNGEELGQRYPDYRRTRAVGIGKFDPLENRPGFAMLLRKDILQMVASVQRPPSRYGHDARGWFFSVSVGGVATIADDLVIYRQHPTSVFGAPQKFVWRPDSSFGYLEYVKRSDDELECAKLLRATAENYPIWSQSLKQSARSLEHRSTLHRIRSRIYRKEATLPERIMASTQIIIRGGYLPDSSKTRLGPLAGLKDLIYGLTGRYKRWPRSISLSNK
ncbi:MAG: glycosyltransferase [Acidobacteriaceae bacterium]